jgi:hypothetical protein
MNRYLKAARPNRRYFNQNRFLDGVELSVARHESEVFNSRLKRGEVKDSHKIVRTGHSICGCGVKGCIFVYGIKDDNRLT